MWKSRNNSAAAGASILISDMIDYSVRYNSIVFLFDTLDCFSTSTVYPYLRTC